MTIVIVSAFEPEIAPLRARLMASAPEALAERRVVLETVGVGMIEASLGTHILLTSLTPLGLLTSLTPLGLPTSLPSLGLLEPGERPRDVATEVSAGSARPLGIAAAGSMTLPDVVLFCGTCGAFPGSGLEVGDVIVSRRVLLCDVGSVLGLGALPGVVPTCVDMGVRPSAARWIDTLARAGAKQADVATTLGITTTDELAGALRATSRAGVEHLEAFGVARACERQGVAFVAVLGVANAVGSRGRETWAANHRGVSATTCEVIARALELHETL